jgi:arabinofuranosyltransferase
VILDRNGLNDRVIANNPPPATISRAMAHDRVPPIGYIDCFHPNVQVQAGRVVITPRAESLTEQAIRECESREWAASDQVDPADLPTRPEDSP